MPPAPISPIAAQPAAEPAKPAATASSKAERASTLAVAKAATRLNDVQFAGVGREITFSFNPDTRRPIVKVVDSDTREVVQQWPVDYLLQQAENINPSLLG